MYNVNHDYFISDSNLGVEVNLLVFTGYIYIYIY